jgi:hypothetical protein
MRETGTKCVTRNGFVQANNFETRYRRALASAANPIRPALIGRKHPFWLAMKKIDGIYIVCHPGDVNHTRPLVASIRHWYERIPITLIKDQSSGPFSTREMEKAWGVQVLQTNRKGYGWGWAKLEPLFEPGGRRYLVLDSDILFAGPALSNLEKHEEDFVVSPEINSEPRSDFMRRTYYDFDRVLAFDPEFQFPGFLFNTGQILATSGILTREDFSGLVDWTPAVPKSLRPETFECSDQGVLNYLLPRKAQRGQISLGCCKFMVWPKHTEAASLNVSRIVSGEGYPLLIHWAGSDLRHPSFKKMLMGELLQHYESEYYSRVRLGETKRVWRYCCFRLGRRWKRLKRQLGPKEIKTGA